MCIEKLNDSVLVEHVSKFSNDSLQHRDETHTVDKHFVHVLRTSAIKLVGGVHTRLFPSHDYCQYQR